MEARRLPAVPGATPARAGFPWLVGAAFAAMCLIWGSTWMVIKIGLRAAPPITGVGVRFLLASIVVGFLLVARRLRLPRERRFILLSMYLGVFQMAIPYVLVYWGETRISSGLTAVLYAMMPLMVAVCARLLLGDALTLRRIAGIVVGVAGVGLIFADSLQVGGSSSSLGVIAVLVSVVMASLANVLAKKYAGPYDPQALLFVAFGIAGAVTLAAGAAIERSNPLRYDLPTWATIFYLAIFGSVVAFSLFLWVLKRLEVTVVSYQTFIIPILAVLLGWLLLDEALAPRTGLGAALVLAGIAVSTRRTRPRPGGHLGRRVPSP